LRARLPLMSDPSRTPEQEAPTPEAVDDWADAIRTSINDGVRTTLREYRDANDALAALSTLGDLAVSLLADKERMDWLGTMVVNVRKSANYGSWDVFWASSDTEDGRSRPSDIRAKIDAARSALPPRTSEMPDNG
jgi:hypothetical protein